MSFEFSTAGRIVFGSGRRRELAQGAAGFGRRVLLVGGGDAARDEWAADLLRGAGMELVRWGVRGEPTVAGVREGVALARASGSEWVVAVGGGSVIDAAKVVAALVPNPGEMLDYLEIIGRGRTLERAPLPFVALPTTAGAGAEVTRNAVITSVEDQVKVSLRSPLMLARLVIVDPELTLGLPPEVTATTGMDALTQVIEPLVSSKANPMADGLCVEAIPRVARSLRIAWADGGRLEAREDMAFASLCGGLALANAGLGAVHGLAAPIGGCSKAPHGAVCAALLAPVMAANVAGLRTRVPGSPALERYGRVAGLLTGRTNARPEDGVDWVRRLVADLGIPGLGAHGLEAGGFESIAIKAARANSMRGNPIKLTLTELRDVLIAAL